MKSPEKWDKEDLYLHLQHALELELWTIPLYLVSMFSIKDLSRTQREFYPPSAKLIFSVVVQEMLHVELVSNLSNALGYQPKFVLPTYDPEKGIPFIHPKPENMPPEIRDYRVELGPLSEESLKLFCAIELPHPKSELKWEEMEAYGSIADLYEAIRVGVRSLWDQCYVGHEKNNKQKDNFKEYHRQQGHGFSITVDSLESALMAIEAIVEQGEGADSQHVPSDFRPPAYHHKDHSDIAWYRDDLSHYQKFRILLHSHDKLPETYSINPTDDSKAKNARLKETMVQFWDSMEANFSSANDAMEGRFWQQMAGVGLIIEQVWQSGMCPDFT